MQAHHVQPGGWLQFVIPLAIAGVVLALRARRMTRVRALHPGRLWMVPALYAALVAALLVQHPPAPLGWLACAAGLAAGCALGWQRGKTMRIHLDPATGGLHQQGSLVAILFLVVLIAVKQGAAAGGAALHLDVGLMTDVLACLALGMFSVMRVEMFLRARRLLAGFSPPASP
ncbi:CcdC protein domain-containing protein [Sphingomonas aracearum]|uniref:DUF1453 family protein n=1 Tax=Sphingomonas aracearum TaxID=2283317 RepID=A0A369VVE6_9SPHN|nr:CcdC protein domain-containing protein [Sphingomonas aracearum]RDE05547.1 DUF1453 family protein [Sphingomonas aracearum]